MFYYVAACVHVIVFLVELPQLGILSWTWQGHWDQHGAATIDSFEPSQKKQTKENPYSNICFYFFNLKLTKHQTSELALNLQFGTLNHYWDTFSSHGYWIKINHVWKQDFPYSCNRAHLWILYFFKADFSFPGSHDGWHLRNSFYSMKSRAVQSRLYWNLHLMERVSLLSASLPI